MDEMDEDELNRQVAEEAAAEAEALALTERNRLIAVEAAAQVSAKSNIQPETVTPDENKKKKRKMWVKEFKDWKKPKSGAKLSVGNSQTVNELNGETSNQFCHIFNVISEENFNKLLEIVKPFINRQNTVMRESIPAAKRLAITLHFLATGESFTNLQFIYRVPNCTVSGIVKDVCGKIYEALRNKYLKTPETKEEWEEVAEKFYGYWNFPNVLGAIDGKHIAFKPFKRSDPVYSNKKDSPSIVLLALVDADYKFLFIDTSYSVSQTASDTEVLKNSVLPRLFSQKRFNLPPSACLPCSDKVLPHVFVSDDPYRLQTHIITPYSEITIDDRVFNYRLHRARRVADNAFGIMSNKFRVLHSKINLVLETVENVTKAVCVLHNFLLAENEIYYADAADYECTESCAFINGIWRQDPKLTSFRELGDNTPLETRRIRDSFREYFLDEGALPWQLDAALKFNF